MALSALVVDDSEIARMYIMDILQRIGFAEITEAENGADGIEKFKQTSPDVVFLDIEMPVMDGLSAVRKLSGMKGTSKIVMMSSVDRTGVIDDCLLAGADDYIRKDLDEDVVEKRIRDIL
ncbi:MAG: response regulator [Alphaproteobacteria bacterium]|nr:response regulator [Alphaproteobacteria bacterium]